MTGSEAPTSMRMDDYEVRAWVRTLEALGATISVIVAPDGCTLSVAVDRSEEKEMRLMVREMRVRDSASKIGAYIEIRDAVRRNVAKGMATPMELARFEDGYRQ